MTNENKKDEGRPAFPTPERTFKTGVWYSDGMTLRDYFAGQALAGLLACGRTIDICLDTNEKINSFPIAAYKLADSMLEARKK